MIDLTQSFIEEILPNKAKLNMDSFKHFYDSTNKFHGRLGLYAKKGTDNVRHLEKLIKSYGFDPVVLETEYVKKKKGYISENLQNLDILIVNPKNLYNHPFAGKEKQKHEEFLGEKGLLLHAKGINLQIESILKTLFTYLITKKEQYEYIFKEKNLSIQNAPTNIIYLDDLKLTPEYLQLCEDYGFIPQISDIKPRSVSTLKRVSFNQFINGHNSALNMEIFGDKDVCVFTFTSHNKELISDNEKLIINEKLEQILKIYNKQNYSIHIQIFSSENLL